MSLFPSEQEIAQARADAVELLPGTCQILTLTETPDGAGGIDETWTPGPEIACRLAPLGQAPAGVTADRISEDTTHVITLPYGTEVTTSDRIELDGQIYAVTAKRGRTDQDTIVRRVEVMEVRN